MFSILLHLDNLTNIITLLFGLLLATAGLHSFIDPTKSSDFVDLPLKNESLPSNCSHRDTSGHLLVVAVGVRTFALGLLVLLFWSQGAFVSIGIICLCMIPIGVVDAAIAWNSGQQRIVWAHIIATFCMGALGVYLVDQRENI